MKLILPILLAAVAIGCGGGGETPTDPGSDTPANCFTANGNICMSVSPISISCADIRPGFEMNCSANVPMNISTKITSGKISVGVGTGGADYIWTSIVILPNTSPGNLTGQIPSTKVGAGCTSGTASHFVEVYDGEHPTFSTPGGRTLAVSSVSASVSWAHWPSSGLEGPVDAEVLSRCRRGLDQERVD